MNRASFNLALITGGSSGIGLAVARELVIAGTSVILAARRRENLAEARDVLTGQASPGALVHTLVLDVADAEAVGMNLKTCVEEYGLPDFVFNGAGMAYPNHFEKIPPEIFRAVIDTNLGGSWNVLSFFVPLMKSEGKGTIVNVSSVSGVVGTYGYTAYAASKFAIIGMSQSLRNELKPEGIDVRVLCPPDTDTPQLAQENLTKPEETRKISGNAGVLQPQAVARSLMKGLRGRRFLIVPGFMAKVTILLYRIAPQLVHFLIDSDVRSVRKNAP